MWRPRARSGFDAVFQHGQAHLLQAGRLDVGEVALDQVDQGGPPPQLERLVQGDGTSADLGPGQEVASLPGELLEGDHVDVLGAMANR